MLDDDLDLLTDRSRMQVGVSGNLSLASSPAQLWVVFDGLFKLIIGFVGHVILEHVQNEILFNRLPHRVEMERLRKAVWPCDSKTL